MRIGGIPRRKNEVTRAILGAYTLSPVVLLSLAESRECAQTQAGSLSYAIAQRLMPIPTDHHQEPRKEGQVKYCRCTFFGHATPDRAGARPYRVQCRVARFEHGPPSPHLSSRFRVFSRVSRAPFLSLLRFAFGALTVPKHPHLQAEAPESGSIGLRALRARTCFRNGRL